MSRFGLWLVETLNKLVPPQKMHEQLHQAKGSVRQFQERDYEEAQRVCPEFGRFWDLTGKSVLDVGGGLGGKARYYAEQGACCVTTIDLREYSTRATLALAQQQRQRSIIEPMIADAAKMPFSDGSFDVIVSINVLEHVASLYVVLVECRRVLRPDGLMFLHFPPFYSPWGAHLEGWIDFPWPHVFFSEKTLIQAARRIEERRARNRSYIAPAQVDWSELERLPDLNRVTVRQSIELIHSLDLSVVEFRLLPLAWHYLGSRGRLSQAALSILKRLSTLHPLREVITTKMIFVLKRA